MVIRHDRVGRRDVVGALTARLASLGEPGAVEAADVVQAVPSAGYCRIDSQTLSDAACLGLKFVS
jgi:hypothetical protein